MNGEHPNTREAPTTETVTHTPGPWSNERIWDTPASRIHARVEGVPMALAEVFTMRNAGEKEANARLIAAAPDLLRMVRAAHAEAHGDCTEEGCSDWCRQFQKVIDKAEGRS